MSSSVNNFKSTAFRLQSLTNKLMFSHALETSGICSHTGTSCSYISHVSISDSRVSDSRLSDSHVSDSHVSYSHVSKSYINERLISDNNINVNYFSHVS